ncbi:MAG: hypothetical protein JW932_08900 [Deltaproteobacteria bacterium]|nr:hypothetical protein [Deltaproteobacteria bacterium]
MSQEKIGFQEDVYGFLGCEMRVQSNSRDILKFLQSVYARFYKGNESKNDDCSHGHVDEDKLIKIIDALSSSNEIIIKSIFGEDHMRCKSLYEFEDDYYATVPDPLAFIQWIVLKNVSLLAKDYQLIHAGAVSLGDSCAIFPAFSGFGKTTLTLQLIQNGFKFLSDEIACIRSDTAFVEPFHRKLNLNDESRRLLGLGLLPEGSKRNIGSGEAEWTLDIEDIVPSSLSPPCVLRYIIFLLGFGEKPRLERIAVSNALFNLFRFSFSSIDNRAKLLYDFAPVIDRAGCYNLVMGDPSETADLISGLFQENQDAIMGL